MRVVMQSMPTMNLPARPLHGGDCRRKRNSVLYVRKREGMSVVRLAFSSTYITEFLGDSHWSLSNTAKAFMLARKAET